MLCIFTRSARRVHIINNAITRVHARSMRLLCPLVADRTIIVPCRAQGEIIVVRVVKIIIVVSSIITTHTI